MGRVDGCEGAAWGGRIALAVAVTVLAFGSCKGKDAGSPGAKAQGIASAKAAPAEPLATSIAFDEASRSFAAFSSDRVRSAAMAYPALKEAVAEAPISLTADDGTGLELESLDARAVIEGPLAFTELHLRFRNPQSRVLEGRFQLTLPEGASVSRLAMKIDGGWQEAEMVERQAARRAYEDFLHRKQDPMLLEKEAGNQFRARIFPIPANGTKEVIVSYSHELSAKQGYRLPLRGLPEVGELKVKAMIAKRDGAATRYEPKEISQNRTVPTEDFTVKPSTALQALRQGNHVVARVQPKLKVDAAPLRALTILFDTSASRAPGYARQVQRLGSLVKAIAAVHGAALPLRVAAFDQQVAPVYEGTAGAFGKMQLAVLLARRPLGASDLGAALVWSGLQKQLDRILVIGDGVSTAGDADLAAIAKALPETVVRIDALLVGGIRDQDAVGRIVRGTRKQDGVVLGGDLRDEEIAQRLGKSTTSLKVSIAGAEWNWPQKVEGVQPGDELVVYGAFGAGQTVGESIVVQFEGGGEISMPSSLVPGTLLTRSVVQAQIARAQGALIAEKDPAKKTSMQEAVVALSTKYRVLSDYTALLVLETDSDYARFGIDRKALVDILAVHDTGLRTEQRQRVFAKPISRADFASAPADVVEEEELSKDKESAGTGTKMAEAEGRMERKKSRRATGQFAMRDNNVEPSPSRDQDRSDPQTASSDMSGVGPGGGGSVGGLSSLGATGSGSGSGVGFGSVAGPGRGPAVVGPAPRVRLGASMVSGDLDKNIIRRFMRRHVPRLKSCYERELPATPALQGTAIARFTIGGTGAVLQSTVEGLGNQNVERCMAAAIKRISFPRPNGGGSVIVAYPFVMEPGSGLAQSPPADSPPQAWGNTGEPTTAQELAATVDPSAAAKEAERNGPPALTGTMATIRASIERGAHEEAVATALVWRTEEAGNVMALVALGESLEASGKLDLAARAYGSIVDLFPSRADLRRFASARLIALGEAGRALSVDSLKKAAEQRPDHLSVHRLLGYAMLRSGDLEGAFAAIETGLGQRYPGGRFSGGIRILREDLGIIGKAWIAADASKEAEVKERLLKLNSRLATQASLRFVLNWETDANDVDFHIYDGQGDHAFYSQRQLPSGGELYADVTTGYGPECFTIEGSTVAYPYAIQIHYYSRGPMGYGMGQVEIMQHDGKGGLKFDARPFVVMNDGSYLALGPINGPL